MIDSVFFFFFKQKTAYEMRISDWSSDVCSSDLETKTGRDRAADPFRREQPLPLGPLPRHQRYDEADIGSGVDGKSGRHAEDGDQQATRRRPQAARHIEAHAVERSEEHTSELQSLMRTSYAVFCLKKKKQHMTPANYTL